MQPFDRLDDLDLDLGLPDDAEDAGVAGDDRPDSTTLAGPWPPAALGEPLPGPLLSGEPGESWVPVGEDDDGEEISIPLLEKTIIGPFAETDGEGRPLLELCSREKRRSNGRRFWTDVRIDSLTHDTTWQDLADDQELAGGDYVVQVRGANGTILGRKQIRLPTRSRAARGRLGAVREKPAEEPRRADDSAALSAELAARREESRRQGETVDAMRRARLEEIEAMRKAHFDELMQHRQRSVTDLDEATARHRKELAEQESRWRRELDRVQEDAERRIQRLREDLDTMERRARDADDKARELREQGIELRMQVMEAKSAGTSAVESLTAARKNAPPDFDEFVGRQVDRLSRVVDAVGKAGALLNLKD